MICRYCGTSAGEVALDLGEQPACDDFPAAGDPGPDPRYPLRMWLCAACGLAQLMEDPTTPEEPRGIEPAALVEQAADAVRRVSGWLPAQGTVVEYGSPHGGSWLPRLAELGLGPGDPADVVLDCFGLMHAADQRAALRDRVTRLKPDGILLLQYHSLETIVRDGQWNALRHGHFAYYSATALRTMLAGAGLREHADWTFDLYGGTRLILAKRGEGVKSNPVDPMRNPVVLRQLQTQVERTTAELRTFLAERKGKVIGYGAASRAVALLCRAGVDVEDLPAIADASEAKWGRRMPGTRIPVISPAELLERQPEIVLLFVPDLLTEVRAALPGVTGWAVAEPVPQLVG